MVTTQVNFRSEERQKRLWHLRFYAFLLLRDAFRSSHHGEFPLAALETNSPHNFWLHSSCPNYFISLLHRTPNSSPSVMQSHSTLPRLRLCSQTAKVHLRLPSLTKPSKLLGKATEALLREQVSQLMEGFHLGGGGGGVGMVLGMGPEDSIGCTGFCTCSSCVLRCTAICSHLEWNQVVRN